MPAPLSATDVRAKVRAALEAFVAAGASPAIDLDAFIDRVLPFPAASTMGGNTPCVEIDANGDEYLLCDMGSGMREFGNAVLAAHGPDKPNTFHVFMSHVHWDHIQGFPFFAPAYLPGNRIVFYGCHGCLRDMLALQHSAPLFPVEFDQLAADLEFQLLEPGRHHHVAGVSVLVQRQRHPGDSYGFRFERDGKAIVYSTDSEHLLFEHESRAPYVTFFRNADVLIFDAQYSLADAATSRENWGHSSNVIGVELAQEARVKQLYLFHHDPAASDQVLVNLLDKTRRYAHLYDPESPLRIELSYDGLDVFV